MITYQPMRYADSQMPLGGGAIGRFVTLVPQVVARIGVAFEERLLSVPHEIEGVGRFLFEIPAAFLNLMARVLGVEVDEGVVTDGDFDSGDFDPEDFNTDGSFWQRILPVPPEDD